MFVFTEEVLCSHCCWSNIKAQPTLSLCVLMTALFLRLNNFFHESMKMYMCVRMCMMVFYVLYVLGMGLEHEHSGNLWHGNACSRLCLLVAQWLAFWWSCDLLLWHTHSFVGHCFLGWLWAASLSNFFCKLKITVLFVDAFCLVLQISNCYHPGGKKNVFLESIFGFVLLLLKMCLKLSS